MCYAACSFHIAIVVVTVATHRFDNFCNDCAEYGVWLYQERGRSSGDGSGLGFSGAFCSILVLILSLKLLDTLTDE